MKKLHWTQTLRGRQIMSRNTRRRHKLRGDAVLTAIKPLTGQKLGREELSDLAKQGARVALDELEKKSNKLRFFLGLLR
jgi:hypothetical protein